MNIVAVSSSYLNALNKESLDYRFNLQAYGNFRSASEGILKTNISDIYGFCIVADSLPDKSASLEKFLYQCNLICSQIEIRRRFVFCLKDDRIPPFLGKGRFTNLDFYLFKFEIMTDLTIRRDIFGTVLDAFLNPYTTNTKPPLVIPRTLKGLTYSQLLPNSLDNVLKDVDLRGTLEDTIAHDPYLGPLKKENSLCFKLRVFGISRMFDPTIVSAPEIKMNLEAMGDSSRELYEMVYSFIVERGLGNEGAFSRASRSVV